MQGRRNRKLPLSMLNWSKYPVRVCRSLHFCEICCVDITVGEEYRDGGYSLRCPSVFVSEDQPRHLPECDAMRAAIAKAEGR